VQTTLLGLAIAFIIALMAALIGPYFIDWNQFRPQFEAEATAVVGAPVRVAGELDARLLPTPTLRLRSVTVGGANDLGKVRADKLDVEFSLGSLMRGEMRADELTINGVSLDLGLDPQGRIDWPVSTGKFNLGSLAIGRLNLTGRIALHDAASHGTLELNDIAFSGDVRSLAGAVRGDGTFVLSGLRYPFRVSSGIGAEGSGTRVHLNIDPGARALSADLDGVLSFEARAPRFEGALVLTVPAGLKAKGDVPITPWRISARIKADHATARLEQLEASYGPEDRALKFTGLGDVGFGASPLLHATLSARNLDADKFAAGASGAAEPLRLLPALRALMANIALAPIPTQIEIGSEQIMLGGRPLQSFSAELRSDAGSWSIARLDFRAPGATHMVLSGSDALVRSPGVLAGALSVESADPDTLVAWLQGRSEISYRSQKPLRLSGNLTVAPDRIAVDAMKAEIDGGAVEGRLSLSNLPAAGGTRLDAELKAERLDLDAATAFARSLAGPRGEWPDAAQLSLNIDRAMSAGQELRPLMAKLGYDPKAIVLDRLKIGQPDNVMLEGGGNFNRADATGKLTLSASAAALGQITALVAPLAPALVARIDAMGPGAGPARLQLVVDLTRLKATPAGSGSVLASLDVNAAQLKGQVQMTATPALAAMRDLDFETLGRSDVNIGAMLSSDQGRALLALLGLDRTVAIGEGPAQFEGAVSGVWRAPLQLKARLQGAGLDADAQGTAEPWAERPRASVNLSVRRVSLAPLFDLRPNDALAQNISLSSRVSLSGNKLTFDDLDSSFAGSRLRGRVALTLDGQRDVEGEVGMDALDLKPVFMLAIGAAGQDPAEPLGASLSKGWRGHIAFQALRGALPGGVELRPVSATVRSDGQSLTLDAIKAGIGGGELSGNIEAKASADGIVLNARVELSGVDGAALRYRALAMPMGRTSMQMTLTSEGRSAQGLLGALSGSGTVTLESARITGLDPRAFEVAIRASDSGQATDDNRLRQIVDPVLSAGALSVKSAQIPFSVNDGRLRVSATTLDAEGARAVISGGYDIPADQADIRATISPAGAAPGGPEIQLFAAGSPDALHRSVDVAALSSWLAVRAIDRETRRLDAIERGEPLPASIPPAAPAPPPALAPKPRTGLWRPPAAPPAPAAAVPIPNAPIVSQQVTPLPPPIEVRPAPGVAPRLPKPKPKPPLLLTPPPGNP
jgi:uncharacterized protein involved in outer membrane biogenesis